MMTTLTMERPLVKSRLRLKKSSVNAKRAADEVIKQMANGGRVNLKRAIKAVGYSDAVAHTPSKVTDQPAYKEVIETWESKIVKLRDKTIDALSRKDLTKEKLYDVTGLLKVADHSVALAQGKSTENIATKTEIVVFGSDDFLSRQLEKGSVKP